MLFSATMTHDVNQLAAYSLKRPVRVTADGSIRTDEAEGSLNSVRVPTSLCQEFVRVRKEHEGDREAMLLCLCTRTFHTRCIVFTREKRRAHRLRILFGLVGLRSFLKSHLYKHLRKVICINTIYSACTRHSLLRTRGVFSWGWWRAARKSCTGT
jgi:superfamily II DNA/RNA helicase